MTEQEGVNEVETEPGPETRNIEAKEKKKAWTHDATLTLINMMGNLLKDLEHPKKRKFVFSTLSEQLISVGLDGYDETSCKVKWKSLLRTYKSNKDAKKTTGSGHVRFYFYEEMDELLGNKPQNSSSHSLDSTMTEQEKTEEDVVASPPEPINPIRGNRKRKLEEKEDEREERRQQRHNERMQLERQKIALLDKIVNKLFP